MKKKMLKRVIFILVVATSLFYFSLPTNISMADNSTSTVIETSVKSILANKDYYDHKEVQVEGEVTKLKFKTSKKGNDYTTFYLADSKDNSLRIFIFKHPSIFKGNKVKVKGVFYKVRYVGGYRFNDEIDATSIKKKLNGIWEEVNIE